jgi:hypothetical protein
MVMFKQELSVQDGLDWSLNTPVFRLSAEQLGMDVEDLFVKSLAYLENKHCLTRNNMVIQNCAYK